MDHIPKTLPDFESAGAVWVSATDVLRKITKADCRAGRATEPLQWFPKVANDEVGMAINTPEYFELENVATTHCFALFARFLHFHENNDLKVPERSKNGPKKVPKAQILPL